MASREYTNAKCGQCSYWKVSRNPLGTCRLDPEYQTTIGRYAKACGAFEEELVIQQAPPAKEQPVTYYKRP
ncbi:MAG: hypothetical protein COB33_005895 [Thiotrichaceae bacterium]|nr:hypothetical protein [Thiotrichaceae bacterium]